ncbi:MAG TPA: hypothetical protein VNF73_15605, partial [Candidatus Saccharimonadales bacterium]|nr:hypothetical protein [Candidatus Saccharimonadales bacterium]
NALVYTDPVLPASQPAAPGGLNTRSVGATGATGTAGVGAAVGTVGVVGNDRWLWSVPTRVGTEPGASAEGAVTRNITGLDDPRVGSLFEKAMSELNSNAQAQTLSWLDHLLSQDIPTLPLFQTPVSLVQRADIVNVSESPSWAGPLWDAEDWAIQLTAPAG